ncbi:Uncharacterized conserved protein (DUF2294) [Carboxydocella thermautotrophica]|nr:Uncharacterized conserved protein (DUF2294) [Carboxydocella thermautotrophica]
MDNNTNVLEFSLAKKVKKILNKGPEETFIFFDHGVIIIKLKGLLNGTQKELIKKKTDFNFITKKFLEIIINDCVLKEFIEEVEELYKVKVEELTKKIDMENDICKIVLFYEEAID